MVQPLPDILALTRREQLGPKPTGQPIFTHRRIIGAKNADVAARPVFCPRHEDAGIAPVIDRVRKAHFPLVIDLDGRHDHGKAAAPPLLDAHIAHPFTEKTRRIEIEGGRRGKQRDVARPPQPLVSLRTVCGDIDKIRTRTVQHILLQAIEPRIRASKATRLPHIGREDAADEGDLLFRSAPNAHIAEPHIGERGHIRLFPFLARIAYLLLCRAQRLCEQLLAHQHFGVAQHDLLPRPAADGKAHDACKVLTEIVDQFAAGRLFAANWLQIPEHADRSTARRLQARNKRQLFDRGKRRGFIFFRRIDHFAVIQICREQALTQPGIPARICTDEIFRTVFVLDVQLGDERLPLCIDAVAAQIGVTAYRPAAGNRSAQQIFLCQHVRYIVCLILDAVAVRCKAGRQIFVTHTRAVQIAHVDAQRRSVQPCAPYLPAQ